VRIETAFYNYLSNKATVTAVVSTRIFPEVVPQELLTGRTDNYPAITYQVISARPVNSHGGSSTMQYTRIQTDSWARTKSAARDLALVLYNALHGYSGTWGGVSGVFIGSVFMEDQSDSAFESAGSLPQRLFGVRQDWMIGHDADDPTL